MALKAHKPTTPTRRHTKRLKFDMSEYLPEDITDEAKELLLAKGEEAIEKHGKKLLAENKYSAGKNNRGVITIRHKGGKVKRHYRTIDFKRDKRNVPGTVVAVEFDPNRSAAIALIKYSDGEYRYILAPNKLRLGDEVLASEKLASLKAGNAYPLAVIPTATFVHNVELVAGKGGVLGRSAGISIQIQGRANEEYVQVKMPSGEVRLIRSDCYATIGELSNPDHSHQKIGKAGTNRRRGIRPTVRGVAQSYKHPHAGGQGKSGRHGTGGPSKDPWGNKRGVITRKNKSTNKFIIERRTSKLRPRNKKYKTIA